VDNKIEIRCDNKFRDNNLVITKKTMSQNNAYLELIIGPMFSGKTSKLLDIYKQCNFCSIPVAILNHSSDTRYHETMLSSHDHVLAPCIMLSKLEDCLVMKQVKDARVILINESQFFEDLYDSVLTLLNHDKKVYICGLDGDFERKKFGQILDLVPLSDKITKLSSLCSLCKDGTPGIFSMRLTDEKDQTLVGVSNYIPTCRKCYSNHS
jgi:thymidine kinase